MRKLAVVLLSAALFISGVAAQNASCSDDLLTGLAIGSSAEMPPGSPNNLRRLPSRSADRVGQVEAGDVMTVINGPECAEGFVWWQVETEEVSGWTPEGILNENGTFGEYYLYREGALVLAEDFEIEMDVEDVAASTQRYSYGAAIKRINTYFPAYATLALSGYFYEEREAFAGLFIEPLDFFDPYVYDYWLEAHALRDLLTEQTTEPDFVPAPAKTFDQLLTQLFSARAAYLEFDNGSGVRFLTAYTYTPEDEDAIPYINYDFQGLTDDGRYYINGNFSVYVDGLDLTFDGGDYSAYLENLSSQLDELPADAFVPSLDTLDAMIKTLNVTGSDEPTALAVEAE